MSWTVISIAEYRRWKQIAARVAAHDIYYQPEYHRLCECANEDHLAYVAELGGELLFHPFAKRPIDRVGAAPGPRGAYDIQTVYGYSGPIATSTADEFLREAWQGFDAWCAEQRIVCEFIRYNPLLGTHRFAAPSTDVVLDRQTVEIRLDDDEQRLWDGYTSAQRNRVRRALKSDLVCEQVPLKAGLSAFRRIYEQTMQRTGAAASYFFSDGYYRRLQEELAGHARLFQVQHRGEPVAAALFFTYRDVVQYHLGGSATTALPLAPNNLLFHEAALWSLRHGFKRLHLGGGRSAAPDDPLLRFKRQFSRQLIPFYLGKRVHDQQRYAALCALWREQSNGADAGSYFPLYRLGTTASGPWRAEPAARRAG
jgi:hypothetical protein